MHLCPAPQWEKLKGEEKGMGASGAGTRQGSGWSGAELGPGLGSGLGPAACRSGRPGPRG